MIAYRRPTDRDIPGIRAVAAESWRHAYLGIYAPSAISRKVELYYSTSSLGEAMGDARSGQAFFLIALDGARVVGYAGGSRIKDPWMDPSKPRGKTYHVSGWELKRIFLLPEYVGRGIGKGLLGRWENFLREKGADRYYVSYHRSNKVAREFYLRNGFVRAREYDDGAARCAMKVMRHPTRPARPAGSVTGAYHVIRARLP